MSSADGVQQDQDEDDRAELFAFTKWYNEQRVRDRDREPPASGVTEKRIRTLQRQGTHQRSTTYSSIVICWRNEPSLFLVDVTWPRAPR